MRQGWGTLPNEIVMAEICQRFGWTFEQYQSQPWWFLEIIRLKMNLEGEYQKGEEEKLKKK